jgi:hypothetical protein
MEHTYLNLSPISTKPQIENGSEIRQKQTSLKTGQDNYIDLILPFSE